MSEVQPRILAADPGAFVRAFRSEIDAALARVLASGSYILGPETAAFETEFAAHLGGGTVVAVGSGTDAIELALRANGLRSGDRVATVANTVSATAAAVEAAGGVPVFVDIDPDDMTLSPERLRACLQADTRRTIKAVVPVHLYGQPAELEGIRAVAAEFGLAVVEDCAQAHGASVGGRSVGTWGEAGAFSFYPTKNLGCLGDGGAVVCRDSAAAEKLRLLRQYGWRERYVSDFSGTNSRLDELQAAILRFRLVHLQSENARRRHLAEVYQAHLPGEGLRLPVRRDERPSVYHQYVIRLPGRDRLRAYLAEQGIGCGVLYPVPLHQQPAYARFATVGLPETERACRELLCLPLHPFLAEADVLEVCQHVTHWLQISGGPAR